MRKGTHKAMQHRLILVMAVILVAAFIISFALGRYPVPVIDVVKILLRRYLRLPLSITWDATMETAVCNVRLPRILLACMVGCALSAAGCAYQSVFQNPMASPDILGASSGAGFGAALAILFGAHSVTITVMAFCFSLFSLLLVYVIGNQMHGRRTVSLLLAGVMIGSLFSSGTSYLKLVADPANELPAITYWLMGSLSGTKIRQVGTALPAMAFGVLILLLLRWRMNLLTIEEAEARSMGVNVPRLRMAVILAATLLTAAAVSHSGMIGWVGLVVPNLCRRVTGADNRYLMPVSMLAGAVFLLIVDDVSRNLLPLEIPIGILTAFIGAPFFLYLMTRKER